MKQENRRVTGYYLDTVYQVYVLLLWTAPRRFAWHDGWRLVSCASKPAAFVFRARYCLCEFEVQRLEYYLPLCTRHQV